MVEKIKIRYPFLKLEEKLNNRFLAALIASYALFLVLPLLWQFMGLNLLIKVEEIAEIISMVIPMILAAIISGILVRRPKLSIAPPVIGGLTALLTAHLFFGHPPDLFSSILNYAYYSAFTFASGAIASIFSLLGRREERHEVVEEVVKEILTCPHCEHEVPADSIFCPLCGGKIREEVET